MFYVIALSVKVAQVEKYYKVAEPTAQSSCNLKLIYISHQLAVTSAQVRM